VSGLPARIVPMLARSVEDAFDDPRWQFEVKWDGFRAIAYRDGQRSTRLRSRNDHDLSSRCPEVVAELRRLPPGCVLDGELVTLGDDGLPSFEKMLQHHSRGSTAAGGAPSLVVFDLLWLDGKDLTARPLAERSARLRTLLDGIADRRRLVWSEPVVGEGRKLFAAARERSLEGIVAKRLDAPYEAGRRSDTWLKIKKHEELWCVAIGFVTERTDDPSRGSDLRSLVIAAPDHDGHLVAAGRVGASLSFARRAALLEVLRGSRRDTPPIPDVPVERDVVFVDPVVALHVRYLEWTTSGQLRAPVLTDWRRLPDPA
jgi:bifunctional non-homologous end joining protein LigD